MHEVVKGGPFGMVAEYETAEAIVDAAHRAHELGYRRLDAYTPFPMHELSHAIDFDDAKVPWMIFFGGLVGCATGFLLQYWVSVDAYPHNVGGRPLFSWPMWIPICFECTVLFAGLTAVFGCVFGLNRLPQPYHPIFNTPNFERASQDKFFLCIEVRDPLYDEAETREFFESTEAINISTIDEEEEGDW